MKQKKGYTLLELLVVIGIIIILIAIGASSYSTAQAKARDAKRKGDLKSISNALEQYYSVCNYVYPATLGTSIVCASPSRVVMPTVPIDPEGASYTMTQPSGTTSSYKICATLTTEAVASYCIENQQ
ncbi:MAG: prepilin-type N-terminal cleavage/methylation domain-containing protein [Candidatus Roizmanbacteria bacterium]